MGYSTSNIHTPVVDSQPLYKQHPTIFQGVAFMGVAWSGTLITGVLFLKEDYWGTVLSLPFLAWTTYLAYTGLNITRLN